MTILPRRLLYAPLLSASAIATLGLSRSAVAFRPVSIHLSSRPLQRLALTTNTPRMSSTDAAAAAPAKKKQQPIVQYIVLRRDLDWPAGAMAAQAAHASLAAVAQALESNHEPTRTYISPDNLPHMTKYVYGVDNLQQLEAVRDKWTQFASSSQEQPQQQSSLHYWWVEQPENIPTAFATWPLERTNKVSKVVKNMKLTFF